MHLLFDVEDKWILNCCLVVDKVHLPSLHLVLSVFNERENITKE